MKEKTFQEIMSASVEYSQQTTEQLQKELKEVNTSSSGTAQQKNKVFQYQKITPLVFKFQIGSTFLISYKQNQFSSALTKVLFISLFSFLMTFPLDYFSSLSNNFRFLILAFMYSIPLLYALLFFLDPGTVFEDEDQNFYQQRLFCITCQIYRNISTKHCSFCNRCCKKYDHHCSVFGKCIGKRNLCIFYTFLINVCLTFILYFSASLGQLFGSRQITN